MNDSYNANLLLGLPLLWSQIGASDYFASLPAEIQQAVNEHADEFHTREELEEFAENMKKKR